MKSHSVEFEPKDLLRLAGGPLLTVAILELLLHLGVAWGVLPGPRPALDTDRTVMVHQVDAARERQDADILLLGDSSCLMDVDARQVSTDLGRRVLNLGLNSYLDLEVHGMMLREFMATHPARPRTIVLLMHPEALRRVSSEPHQLSVLSNYFAGADSSAPQTGWSGGWTGAERIKGRLLSRIPQPLGGAFGRYYGFSMDLERFMWAHNGSALDPGNARAIGDAEYRLSVTLEGLSRKFRDSIPSGSRLLIGITPVPGRFAGEGYPARRDVMLGQWGQWLGLNEESLLKELPAVLPDEQFTGTTHLRPAAVPIFSERLGKALKEHLR